MSPVDTSQRDQIVDALERRYKDTIHKGDVVTSVNRIPTGSLNLDLITGGGIPMGRWSRFYGTFSSGKTRAAWSVVREAQAMGLECAYYNVEGQYESDAVERAGVDISELELIEGSTIEETAEKLESMLGVCHVHVIDSCSNAVAIDELNADLTEWRPGLMARAWAKALRRCHERLDKQENTVILIDHLGTDFGGFGKGKRQSSDKPKGGKFLGYLSSMSLNFRRGKWLWYDKHGHLTDDGTKAVKAKTLSDQDEPDGREIIVRCEKSRVGRPEMAAVMHFDGHEFEFDHNWEFLTAMKWLGMVDQAGAWWTYRNGRKKPEKVQGDAGLRKLIVKHDLKDEIYERVLETERQR